MSIVQPENPREQATNRSGSSFAGISALCLLALLAGCSKITLLHPRGPIGESELFVIGVAFALMLIVVIPVIFMAFWFPRRYKASNPKGSYDPQWNDSIRVDAVIWLIPAVIVLILATLTWTESHRLDPFRPIDSRVTPINIETVSLDWKWLFIYPDQNIATVNHLVIPVGVPVSFRITSGTVMTSFFIPQLGSQIYAMAGKQSRLHLMADEPGVYTGQNQQFSGRGFADMHFKVMAVSQRQFDDWVKKTRQSPDRLDPARFEELGKPGVNYPVTSFSWVSPGLFDEIVNSYRAKDGMPGAMHAKTAALEGH
jgi:cytochrome o ubiquinol oxidase subunit II